MLLRENPLARIARWAAVSPMHNSVVVLGTVYLENVSLIICADFSNVLLHSVLKITFFNIINQLH